MRVLILNQYAPPDPSPTARLLGELADFMRAQGHEVEIVSPSQEYHGRSAGGRGRMRRELKALLTIFRDGWRATRRKPDLILALSSPPGLLVIAGLLARLRRVRLAHWAMDLYPELAVALDEIRAGFASRMVGAAMGWAYRRAALIVALDDDMRAHLQAEYKVDSRVLAPWPAMGFERQVEVLDQNAADGSDQPWVWLYSGNLGRAHEWETLLETQRLLELRGLPIHLVFQGDGAARHAAMRRAEQFGLKRCVWKGYVPEDELIISLLAARLLVVSQRLETRGLLWPSKLAALERLPRPILYVGPSDGAIARRLAERGNAATFAPGQAEIAARWIEDQSQHSSAPSTTVAHRPSATEGCACISRWLSSCLGDDP